MQGLTKRVHVAIKMSQRNLAGAEVHEDSPSVYVP